MHICKLITTRLTLERSEHALLAERVILAKQNYLTNSNNSMVIMTGGFTAPNIPISEAHQMKLMAIKEDVPHDIIITEGKARDTIDNATFSKEIIDRAGIKNVCT